MEGDSSQSFLGSLIKNLSASLKNEAEQENENKNYSNSYLVDEDSNSDDLDWMETSAKIDDQDMVDSMNIHKRILDSEIDTIDKELDSILKSKETVDYLVSLVKKREKLETRVHRLEGDLQEIQLQQEG